MYIVCMNSTWYFLILALPRICSHCRFPLPVRMRPPPVMCWKMPVTVAEPKSIQGFKSIAANTAWIIQRPSIKRSIKHKSTYSICWALFFPPKGSGRSQPMHPQSLGPELSVSLQGLARKNSEVKPVELTEATPHWEMSKEYTMLRRLEEFDQFCYWHSGQF